MEILAYYQYNGEGTELVIQRLWLHFPGGVLLLYHSASHQTWITSSLKHPGLLKKRIDLGKSLWIIVSSKCQNVIQCRVVFVTASEMHFMMLTTVKTVVNQVDVPMKCWSFFTGWEFCQEWYTSKMVEVTLEKNLTRSLIRLLIGYLGRSSNSLWEGVWAWGQVGSGGYIWECTQFSVLRLHF